MAIEKEPETESFTLTGFFGEASIEIVRQASRVVQSFSSKDFDLKIIEKQYIINIDGSDGKGVADHPLGSGWYTLEIQGDKYNGNLPFIRKKLAALAKAGGPMAGLLKSLSEII